MNIINTIIENKEWIFSGVGILIVGGIIKYFYRRFNNTSDLITVTIAGGAYLGPIKDTPITINKNEIAYLDNPYCGEIGTTVIVMKNGTRHYVTDTKSKIIKLTKK
ncbi:MAG: hypothetical protein BGO30_02790 [Bacteroidetes bacterium 41-46]|nr:MAG: hypothetical protein BGO30_02790 [Bacteroidetes bacterium 41-46]